MELPVRKRYVELENFSKRAIVADVIWRSEVFSSTSHVICPLGHHGLSQSCNTSLQKKNDLLMKFF